MGTIKSANRMTTLDLSDITQGQRRAVVAFIGGGVTGTDDEAAKASVVDLQPRR